MFNRLALVLDEDFLSGADISSADVFSSYQAGGLLNQVRPVVVKEYRSLKDTLECLVVPQMLRGDDWEGGKGMPHGAFDKMRALLLFYARFA